MPVVQSLNSALSHKDGKPPLPIHSQCHAGISVLLLAARNEQLKIDWWFETSSRR